jgi:hypothetical protein
MKTTQVGYETNHRVDNQTGQQYNTGFHAR